MAESSAAAKSSEHAAARGPDGRWKKGVSPNAGGRAKKDRDFAALAQEYLEAEDEERKLARGQCLIAALYGQALDGNVPAARELLDRTYGKPAQAIALGGDLVGHLAGLAQAVAQRQNGHADSDS